MLVGGHDLMVSGIQLAQPRAKGFGVELELRGEIHWRELVNHH